MKKVLSLCLMVIISTMLHANVYTFTTNVGVFKFNDQTGSISFKGVEYEITNYKDAGAGANYMFCEHDGIGKLFLLDFTNGKISEYNYIETFEWESVALYNKKVLVAGLYRNIPTYIQNARLSGDKEIAFREAANQFIKGIENGTVTMKGDGTFNDSTGTMSSTGKFDKSWTGKSKNTSNNAFNLVGDYALDYIRQMPTCDSNWELVASPYTILKIDTLE